MRGDAKGQQIDIFVIVIRLVGNKPQLRTLETAIWFQQCECVIVCAFFLFVRIYVPVCAGSLSAAQVCSLFLFARLTDV